MKKISLLSLLTIAGIIFISAPASALDNNIQDVSLQRVENNIISYQNELDALCTNEINDATFSNLALTAFDSLEETLNLSLSDIENFKDGYGLSNQKHDLLQVVVEEDIMDINDNYLFGDKEKVVKIVEKLFFLRGMNISDEKAYDFTIFMNNPDDLSNSLQFFVDYANYRKNLAVVNVTIDNYYLYDNSTGHELVDYEITLIKEDGIWLVSDIQGGSNFEQDVLQSNGSLSVYLNNLTAPSVIEKEELQSEIEAHNSKVLEILSETTSDINLARRAVYSYYNGSYAANYALRYALNYNSYFPDYKVEEADCMNFGSQCMWYGMGGTNSQTAINNRNFPMITGLSSSYNWHPGVATWTYCPSFMNFLNTASSYHSTPLTVWSDGCAAAQKGDLILIKYPGSSTWDHVYIVNDVSTESVDHPAKRIYVCAHTDDIKNVKLYNRFQSSISYYTFITVHPLSQEYV